MLSIWTETNEGREHECLLPCYGHDVDSKRFMSACKQFCFPSFYIGFVTIKL